MYLLDPAIPLGPSVSVPNPICGWTFESTGDRFNLFIFGFEHHTALNFGPNRDRLFGITTIIGYL